MTADFFLSFFVNTHTDKKCLWKLEIKHLTSCLRSSPHMPCPVSGLQHGLHKICINKKGFSFHFDYMYICLCVCVYSYNTTTTTSIFQIYFIFDSTRFIHFLSIFFSDFLHFIFMRNLYMENCVFYCVAFIGDKCCEKCSSIYIQ